MSSAGHIFDMINRIKQNKISKRKKFKGDNRENIYSEKFDSETEYDFPSPTNTEIDRLKLVIRKNTQQDRQKSYFILAISIVIASLAIWFFLQYFKVGFDGYY